MAGKLNLHTSGPESPPNPALPKPKQDTRAASSPARLALSLSLSAVMLIATAQGMAAVYDPQELILVGSRFGGVLQILDAKEGRLLGTGVSVGYGIWFVRPLPDGRNVVLCLETPAGTPAHIAFADVSDPEAPTLRRVQQLPGCPPDPALDMAGAACPITSDGKRLLVGSGRVKGFQRSDGMFALYDLDVAVSPPQAEYVACGETGTVLHDMAISPGGKSAYLALPQFNQVRTADLASGLEILATTPFVDSPVASGLVLTPDGSSLLVTDFHHSSVTVFNTVNRTPLGTIDMQGGSVRGYRISPDGSRAVLTENYPPGFGIVDLTVPELPVLSFTSVPGNDQGFTNDSIEFTQSGKHLVVCTSAGLLVYDLTAQPPVRTATISGNYQWAVAARWNGPILLGPCDPSAAWRNHGQFVSCVAQEANRLVDAGTITREQADDLVTNAAHSRVGR